MPDVAVGPGVRMRTNGVPPPPPPAPDWSDDDEPPPPRAFSAEGYSPPSSCDAAKPP